MEYLVEPQGIDTRDNCNGINIECKLGVCAPNLPEACNANCGSFCGGQLCSPRVDPMSLN